MRKRKLSQKAQARWSRKQKRLGCCSRCGQPRDRYRQLCNPCATVFAAYMKAWRAARRAKAVIS